MDYEVKEERLKRAREMLEDFKSTNIHSPNKNLVINSPEVKVSSERELIILKKKDEEIAKYQREREEIEKIIEVQNIDIEEKKQLYENLESMIENLTRQLDVTRSHCILQENIKEEVGNENSRLIIKINEKIQQVLYMENTAHSLQETIKRQEDQIKLMGVHTAMLSQKVESQARLLSEKDSAVEKLNREKIEISNHYTELIKNKKQFVMKEANSTFQLSETHPIVKKFQPLPVSMDIQTENSLIDNTEFKTKIDLSKFEETSLRAQLSRYQAQIAHLRQTIGMKDKALTTLEDKINNMHSLVLSVTNLESKCQSLESDYEKCSSDKFSLQLELTKLKEDQKKNSSQSAWDLNENIFDSSHNSNLTLSTSEKHLISPGIDAFKRSEEKNTCCDVDLQDNKISDAATNFLSPREYKISIEKMHILINVLHNEKLQLVNENSKLRLILDSTDDTEKNYKYTPVKISSQVLEEKTPEPLETDTKELYDTNKPILLHEANLLMPKKLSNIPIQDKLKKILYENEELKEELKKLQYINTRLSGECDTIADYIEIYQTQRAKLQAVYNANEYTFTQIFSRAETLKFEIIQGLPEWTANNTLLKLFLMKVIQELDAFSQLIRDLQGMAETFVKRIHSSHSN